MKIVKLQISKTHLTNDIVKRWFLVDYKNFNRHIRHRSDGPAETWLNLSSLTYDHFFCLNGQEADAPLDWEKNKSYTGGLVPF